MWELGDYRPVGEMLHPAARSLVRSAGAGTGNTVLDVGTGSGNVAVAAAEAGAEVTGVDITDAWFDEARRRAADAGVEIDLGLGDAEDLPFDDGSFDVVLSSFAAIFAPRHQRVANELSRVCRAGGVIGINAWMPDGRSTRMLNLLSEELPDPPDFVDPSIKWGEPDYVETLFDPSEVSLVFDRPVIPIEFPSVDAFEDFALSNSGGFIKAREVLEGIGKWPQVARRLRNEMEAVNEADDASFRMTWDYLQILGRKTAV